MTFLYHAESRNILYKHVLRYMFIWKIYKKEPYFVFIWFLSLGYLIMVLKYFKIKEERKWNSKFGQKHFR